MSRWLIVGGVVAVVLIGLYGVASGWFLSDEQKLARMKADCLTLALISEVEELPMSCVGLAMADDSFAAVFRAVVEERNPVPVSIPTTEPAGDPWEAGPPQP